jgi:cytoskeletal protein CcmA (bactofilin family)
VANIGESVVFKGDLSGDEDLVIEGHVEGVIQLPNHQLTIGEHGRVKAEIEAKVITVVGRVAGNVVASERCEVQATGIVDGDIRAPRLTIQEGAVVNGKIEMGQQSQAPQTGEATSDAPSDAAGPARRTG